MNIPAQKLRVKLLFECSKKIPEYLHTIDNIIHTTIIKVTKILKYFKTVLQKL